RRPDRSWVSPPVPVAPRLRGVAPLMTIPLRRLEPGPPDTSFGGLLRHLRIRVGWSQNQLAREAGIDPAYVNRFEKGAQGGPSRKVVLALADVLECGPRYREELLVAAGHCPQTILDAGGWTAYIDRVR